MKLGYLEIKLEGEAEAKPWKVVFVKIILVASNRSSGHSSSSKEGIWVNSNWCNS